MPTSHPTSSITLLACAILLAVFVPSASAQTNPCGTPSAETTVTGLTPVDSGRIVYDSNQGVCWLADANLAAEPQVQALLHPGSGISPNGLMDYATAKNFVNALNHYGPTGYLGHQNWQLPNTPLDDTTCSEFNIGNFGVSCTGSALSNLYYNGLTVGYPQSVISLFTNTVGPFQNLQPSRYWVSGTNSGGKLSFSFNSNQGGSNTTKWNYLYVLPVLKNSIGTPPCCTGILPYTSGPAAGLAVYDTATGYTWPLDANLAASNNFDVTGNTTIVSDVNDMTYTVPVIESDGAMLFGSTAGWIAGMQTARYAGGGKNWKLPSLEDLQTLYTDLALTAGATAALRSTASVGPFQNLQPGFYWSCERDPGGNAASPCDYSLVPPGNLPYSFNFNDGFVGTDESSKQFYVMVYFPAD